MANIKDALLPDILEWSPTHQGMRGYRLNYPGEFIYFSLIALQRPFDGKWVNLTGSLSRWLPQTGERRLDAFVSQHETWVEAEQAIVKKFEEWISLLDSTRVVTPQLEESAKELGISPYKKLPIDSPITV